jgi:hypothetical protein
MAARSAVEEPGLSGLRQRYEQAAIELAGWEMDQQKSAADRYGAFLDQARQQLQQKGDLDGYLAVQAEQKRLESEKTIATGSNAALHPLVAIARTGYATTVAAAKRKREERFHTLTSRYAETLDAMKRSLTVAGKIQEALAVRDEAERVRKLIRPVETAGVPTPPTGVTATPPPGQRMVVCGVCDGTGKQSGSCSKCGGTGRCSLCNGRGVRPGGLAGREHDEVMCMRCKRSGKCAICSGSGKTEKDGGCATCGGSGKIARAVMASPATDAGLSKRPPVAPPPPIPEPEIEDSAQKARLRSDLARELAASIQMTYRLRQRFTDEDVEEGDFSKVMVDPAAHVGKVIRSRSYLLEASARAVAVSAQSSGTGRVMLNTYSKSEGDQAALLLRASSRPSVWVTYGIARPDHFLVFKTEAAE